MAVRIGRIWPGGNVWRMHDEWLERLALMNGIRLGSWESARAFKGIICVDISEFES